MQKLYYKQGMSTAGVLLPKSAAKFIAERSKDVKISLPAVQKTASTMIKMYKENKDAMDADRWKLHALNPKSQDEAALNWVFVTDLLNFSFWSQSNNEKYMVRYGGQEWTGYWSLCAAINRALDEGIAITDPKFYSTITREQLEHVFRSDSATAIPLFEERLSSLHSAGKVLLEKHDGRFLNVVQTSDKSATKLLQLVLRDFETFRDEAEYDGQRVGIYKRGQILVGDLWACFSGKGYGEFTDIHELTAFADYRIPQALIWFGVLEYSDQLMELLMKDHMFNSGERLEVEIRGCTLWAIELIVAEMNKMLTNDSEVGQGDTNTAGGPINSIIVDHFMWDYRREHDAETNDIPFHKIRCIYY